MESTFVDITRKIYGDMDNYGVVSKAIVEMVAELTPFQIRTVIQNDNSKYAALLSFPGYPYLLYMGNNSQYFSISLANADGVVLTGTATSSVILGRDLEASGVNGEYVYYSTIRVVFSSVNGILNGIQITPGNGGAYVGAMISWAVSEYTGETLGFYSTFAVTGGGYGYSTIGFLGYAANITSAYGGNSANIRCLNPYESRIRLSDTAVNASCAWTPVRMLGYLEPNLWFGRLLWGGKYTMYCLTRTDLTTPVTTTPGIDYVVDGKIYKAVFNELYDLREN